jgi:glycosyltransferase involved in cell wall biosynthesis
MRILWHSNAPWSASGYGQQTKFNTPIIEALGHNIAISAYCGLDGAILNMGNIPVYPRRYDPYGNDVILAHANNFKADVIMSLMDVWVLHTENWPFGTRWIPWFPIDHDTMPEIIRGKLSQAWRRITFSRHAERLTHEAGLDCYYIPHGVDTNIFKPGDKIQAREKLNLPKDAWIIGTVAMNKGNPSRKCFVEMMEAFANCKKRHTDMVYFLQADRGEGIQEMVNLPELIRNLGLVEGKDIIFCNQYVQQVGYPTEYMADVYSALDCHMLVSMGEGFGIPILEAQACGTPVIVGDWTAMTELCFSGRMVSKKDADRWYTPFAAYQYRPRVRAIELAIEAEYKMPSSRDKAQAGAQAYDLKLIGEKYWKPIMNEIQEAVNAVAF